MYAAACICLFLPILCPITWDVYSSIKFMLMMVQHGGEYTLRGLDHEGVATASRDECADGGRG